jgi:hypothetical protein
VEVVRVPSASQRRRTGMSAGWERVRTMLKLGGGAYGGVDASGAEADLPSTQRHYSWVRRREGGVRARVEGTLMAWAEEARFLGGARASERGERGVICGRGARARRERGGEQHRRGGRTGARVWTSTMRTYRVVKI